MGAKPKFGTQGYPIELEAEDADDKESLTVAHKKPMALLHENNSSAKDSTLIDSSLPVLKGWELVPYKKRSSPPHASQDSISCLKNAKSGKESTGCEEGSLTLDAVDHASGSPGAPRGFKRLAKAHKLGNGNITDVKLSPKTELEREMELFEAAEREEEARLLTSLRNNQSNDCSLSPKSPNSIESKQTDGKRGSSETLGDQPKPKRGRRTGVNHQALRKEEDVCFACFDGGQLILCDKRCCPKAYHMECTGRESEFFLQEGQWFCGWHVCARCSRSANMHCYTCPTAYCSSCTKEDEFICIRKDRGLCEMCYHIVYMIEHNLSIDSEGAEVNFDDEETYECLFKGYWKDLKEKLSLPWSEIYAAYRAKDEGQPLSKVVSEDDRISADFDYRPLTRQSQRLKRKKVAKNLALEDASCSEYEEEKQEEEQDKDMEEGSLRKPKRGGRKGKEFIGWASKELKEFLHSIGEDSKKPLTLVSLNKLLLRYVDTNKLSSRYRGQIRCDERLQRVFGKKNVGKFQMMKLLSTHIASKRTTNTKDGESLFGIQDNLDGDNGDDKGQKRKLKRKVDDIRQVKSDPSSYAAIDMKNIGLIYLKRSLLEDLRGDSDFESKVTGAFVRIRVPSMVNKNDSCYRLVQIVGVKQTANPRGKAVNIILEILNLHKREEITVDLVSSQDFTEEECQRLRQSVKCGLLKAITVGELQEKARILRDAKVKDWFETELVRLSHLRDRASEKGRRKELRECVERIQLLSSPSERERRLQTPIEVTSDPRMDPDYESDKAGKVTEATQGTESLLEPQFGKGHHNNSGGWAEAGQESRKDHSDHLFGKPAQGWDYAEKPDGWEEKGGFKQDDGWGGGSMQGDGWGEKKVERSTKNENRSGSNTVHNGWCEGDGVEKGRITGGSLCILEKEKCEKIAGSGKKGSGWGGKGSCEIVGNGLKNDGLKDKGVKHKSDDGWGENGIDDKGKDGWGSSAAVNSDADGWGHAEGGDGKKYGWGGYVDDKSKDDGLEDNADPQSKDDGLGGNAGGNFKRDVYGGSAAAYDKDDGWGPSARGGGCRRGGNTKNDGWGPIAAGEEKDDGWGPIAAGNEKDDGWGCRAGGNSKDAGWGHSTGGGSKDDRWGCSPAGDSKDGGRGCNRFGNDNDNGRGRNAGGNGNGDFRSAPHKDDGRGRNAGAHSKDDGWGGKAGAPSKGDGWGYHSSENEKAVRWGSGNERRTGSEWGKPGGNRRDHGWETNANDVERNSGWKNRSTDFDRRERHFGDSKPPYRETEGFDRTTGFDRRERYFGADSKPPYREAEGFDRTLGQTNFSAPVRGAVPDVSARLGVNGAGMAGGNEREKIWFYEDPRKTTQGPFSMDQLRKWERTKLFPLDLKIWRATDGQDSSILLTDALLGRFNNDLPPGFALHAQNAQGFSRAGLGAADDIRNSPVEGSSRSGSSRQDRDERSKWDQDNTGSSYGECAAGARPWRSHGSDRQSPRDGGRDDFRGHRDWGANYRGHSEHHSLHMPSNDSRFGTKKDFPCRFFARGICKKGDECDFRH